MKVSFYGAAGMVTGSKHLLETWDGKKILLDCGLFQGGGVDINELNRHFGFAPNEVEHLLLSHAHIDHSGLIPRLVAEGFRGTIWCTPATRDLCEIMLYDSAFIQENDLKHVNKRRKKRGETELEPLYTPDDVQQALSMFSIIEYEQEKDLYPDFSFSFYDSGHIIGSGGIYIRYKEDDWKSLFFTGDIGRPNDLILRNPSPFPQADAIICESTYGDRLHKDRTDQKARLLRTVRETCQMNKGKLLIPAFSVDRTQELIYLLDQLVSEGEIENIPVYVDSPLSIKATAVMKQHESYFNPEITDYIHKDGDAFAFPNLHYIANVEESKKLNFKKDPCIIISASGMAEAGRIKHHLANNIEDGRNTVLIVGYATPSSLAGQLRLGEKEVRIFGEDYHVKASVEIMDEFSAHADYEEMIEYLKCQNPAKVKQLFLVHGEEDVQEEFKQKLMLEGFVHIHIPELTDEYEL
ncbi:MAG: MBL fold metallo-hydrolase [Bacteroidetes bacterium]|nr:MAG: MBL fold metallo-hydrolase [Bacteroidota bacterium]